MKKEALLVSLVFAVLLVGLVGASFELGVLTVGNETVDGVDVFPTYGPTGTLAGTINLSLDEELFDSVFSATFSGAGVQTTTLKEFLDAQSEEDVDYTCSTSGCEVDYIASNAEAQKDISATDTIGLKITGEDVVSVSGFTLSVSSGALQTCTQPLRIDVLDDGVYEWYGYESTGAFDCTVVNSGYGCYESSDKESDASVSTNKYCSKIEIAAAPDVQIGADLSGSDSNIEFEMEIFNDNHSSMTCDLLVSGSGEAMCTVDMAIESKEEFDVCINAKTADDSNLYTVGLENIDACGYVGSEAHDFAIFARPGKYDAVGSFVLTTEELDSIDPALSQNTNIEDYIMNYVSDNYLDDCSNGCVIPIKVETSSQVILSSFSMAYELGSGLSQTTTNLYDLSEGSALISMDATALDLSKAGFRVPEEHDDYDLAMSLGGVALDIGDVKITVLEAPVVDTVYPQKAPVGLEVVFRIFTSGEAADTYTWDFGDNVSIQTTTTNKLVHKYTETGTYTLTASVENELGKDSRSFTIEVVSPSEYMDELFQESQDGIDAVRAEIGAYPAWLESYFETLLDLDNKEVELNTLKTQYDGSGGATTDYVDIINSIDELWIPTDIETKPVESLDFLIDKNEISTIDLETLGAGTSRGTEEDIKTSIVGWSQNNVDIKVEQEKYKTYHDSSSQVTATKFSVKIIPIKPQDTLYFVINKEKTAIGFEGSLSTQAIGASTGTIFTSVSNTKELEFILPGEVEILELPVYLSPAFSELSVVSDIDVCNNNGVCDSGRGEDSSNCRADCKPWFWILFWILIILLAAFCVYVALQEWYKRKYESHLFPNKNDLYNLINFMDNAEKQGLKREQIFERLKEKGWTHEQIVYAWRKYKGLRTGMWEVPVFKAFEKTKTKKEIAKRRQAGQTGKIAPIPHTKAPIHTKPKLSKKHLPEKHNINKGKSSFTFKK